MNGIIGMTDLTLETEGLTRSQKENLMLVEFFAPWLVFFLSCGHKKLTARQVRALQGAGSSLRGSCNNSERQEHQACKS